jgi:gluconate 2-dehydrogenase gamma chain
MKPEENNGPESSLGRRALLKALTAFPAAALIPSPPVAGRERRVPDESPAPETEYKTKVLNEHEWKTVSLLSDLIIPADERTGSATQAGVPKFIDDWLDLRRGEVLAAIRGGLVWLDMECNHLFSQDFVDCSGTQQKQVLDRIAYPAKAASQDANAVAFFNHLRDLVVSGFFSSKLGIKDLPYLGNTMVADWKGCPPDVLAKLRL